MMTGSSVKEVTVRKLDFELSVPIESERQVVYILILIRKLAELNDLKPKDWPQLWFLSNWVAHPLISRPGWGQKMLVRLDGFIEEGRNFDSLGCEDQAFLQNNFSLQSFRDILIDNLRTNGVRPMGLCDVYQWRAFMIHLGSALESCPLELKNGNNIQSVELRVTQAPADVDSLKLEVSWHFSRADAQEFIFTSEIDFEVPDGHFGRRGTRAGKKLRE